MSARPIVFLDTETTNLQPDRRAWEIAMVRRDEHGDRETHIFVSDVDLSNAEPFALRLGGFYERHPQYSEELTPGASLLTRYDAAKRVEKWTRGATIVGVVPSFDTELLDRALRGHNRRGAWDYHLVDIRNLALGCGWQVDLDVKTDQLAELCGVAPAKPEDRHTALGDARWTRDWYDHITTAGADPSEALLTKLFANVAATPAQVTS